jgi:hypothetical protein
MKSKNRIRPNRSVARPSLQAKTPPAKTVTVIYYSAATDKELARVEFPNAIYAAVLRVCKKLKCTVEQFFELAIRSKLERDLIILNPDAPSCTAQIVRHRACLATGGAR